MIETILASLRVASICGTGALFLKWCKAEQTISEQKKELNRLQADGLAMKNRHDEEMANLIRANASLQTKNRQLQRPRQRGVIVM